MKNGKVTIVVPIYGDWPSLKDCINSLKEHVDTNKHRIIFVNDCGPRADLIEQNVKQTLADQHNYYYFRNSKNLGFVRTCNRAVFELDKTDNDVLLLNSDTKVIKGFLDEMLEVLYSDSKIGTVSPRSNNATIATIPLSAANQKGINPQQSYKVFIKLKSKLPRYSEVPTAHGFCILIRRGLIKRLGLFDPAFGKGYGEEVDFCQRIKKRGYISVLSNWSYVFHLEARSFTLEAKKMILEKNNQIIRQRYPGYQQSVKEYIERALKIEERLYTTGSTKPASENILKKDIQRNRKIHWLTRNIRKVQKQIIRGVDNRY